MHFKMINSLKEDGNMSFNYGKESEVLENRKRFLKKANIDITRALVIKANSKDEITEVDEAYIKEHGNLFETKIFTDCVITRCPNLFLFLAFGDCIPFGVYDRKQEIMALAHLGWQSVELDLHKKVIQKLINDYGSHMEDIEVVLGPSIKKESYVLTNPSQLKYDNWKPFLEFVGDGKYHVDLNGYTIAGLKEIGVQHITNSKINTATDDTYFSHYRFKYIKDEDIEGRFICGFVMTEEE